jgi:hypothetical protein
MVWLIKNILTGLGLIKAVESGSGAAACTSNLLVDDYARWSSNLNTLGQWTSGKNGFSLENSHANEYR